jgi:hypothetical protein
MTATRPDKPICLPPAPANGGALDTAPPKVGDWAWQPKIDDRRVVIHAPSRTVWNQYGQLSVAHRDEDKFDAALDSLAALSEFFTGWFDAGLMEYRNDMMRGSIVILDLIDDHLPFSDRRSLLAAMFPTLPWATELVGTDYAKDNVFLIPQFGDLVPLSGSQGAHAEATGRELYTALQAQNGRLGRKFYEGVVAKRIDSLYPTHAQRPKTQVAAWIKHRFDQ